MAIPAGGKAKTPRVKKADRSAAQDREERYEKALRKIAEATPSSEDAVTVAGCFFRVRGEARWALSDLSEFKEPA